MAQTLEGPPLKTKTSPAGGGGGRISIGTGFNEPTPPGGGGGMAPPSPPKPPPPQGPGQRENNRGPGEKRSPLALTLLITGAIALAGLYAFYKINGLATPREQELNSLIP